MSCWGPGIVCGAPVWCGGGPVMPWWGSGMAWWGSGVSWWRPFLLLFLFDELVIFFCGSRSFDRG